MGHAQVLNFTAYAASALFVNDTEGRPCVLPIVKITYDIGLDGSLALAEKPEPILPGGVPWGEPGLSSWRYEPEAVPPKPSTDVVLVGHAWSRRADRTKAIVDFRVGSLRQVARVYGERRWTRRLLLTGRTKPKPFETIPLNYENAFGGSDHRPKNPKRRRTDPRNPLGRGFHVRGGRVTVGELLPNIEDPRKPVRGYHDRPPVAGFGFTSPHWHPRVKLAGTYDDTWQKKRMPRLPEDFDLRWYQGAAPRLIAPKPLGGTEPVLVDGASSRGRLRFELPGPPAPRCRVRVRLEPDVDLTLKFDTLVVDTDEHKVSLIFRSMHSLRDGPHDIDRMEFRTDDPRAAKSEEP